MIAPTFHRFQILKSRLVWDKTSCLMREGKFLRLSVNDSYNMNMNNVDIADQLRGNYRTDRWMRKLKWWWALFFWGHNTMLVNAYVSYKTFIVNKGKTPLSHYELVRWLFWQRFPQQSMVPTSKRSWLQFSKEIINSGLESHWQARDPYPLCLLLPLLQMTFPSAQERMPRRDDQIMQRSNAFWKMGAT